MFANLNSLEFFKSYSQHSASWKSFRRRRKCALQWISKQARREVSPHTALIRFASELIPQRLMPRRDNAIRRRFRWLLPRFQQLLNEAGRDNVHASGARDFSLPFPEAQGPSQNLHTIPLPDRQ